MQQPGGETRDGVPGTTSPAGDAPECQSFDDAGNSWQMFFCATTVLAKQVWDRSRNQPSEYFSSWFISLGSAEHSTNEEINDEYSNHRRLPWLTFRTHNYCEFTWVALRELRVLDSAHRPKWWLCRNCKNAYIAQFVVFNIVWMIQTSENHIKFKANRIKATQIYWFIRKLKSFSDDCWYSIDCKYALKASYLFIIVLSKTVVLNLWGIPHW